MSSHNFLSEAPVAFWIIYAPKAIRKGIPGRPVLEGTVQHSVLHTCSTQEIRQLNPSIVGGKLEPTRLIEVKNRNLLVLGSEFIHE